LNSISGIIMLASFTRPPRMFWYSISFSAWPRSSTLCSYQHNNLLQPQTSHTTEMMSVVTLKVLHANLKKLCKPWQRHVVTVKIGEEGMVDIGDVVFNAAAGR
jgi:hypothetical protein